MSLGGGTSSEYLTAHEPTSPLIDWRGWQIRLWITRLSPPLRPALPSSWLWMHSVQWDFPVWQSCGQAMGFLCRDQGSPADPERPPEPPHISDGMGSEPRAPSLTHLFDPANGPLHLSACQRIEPWAFPSTLLRSKCAISHSWHNAAMPGELNCGDAVVAAGASSVATEQADAFYNSAYAVTLLYFLGSEAVARGSWAKAEPRK